MEATHADGVRGDGVRGDGETPAGAEQAMVVCTCRGLPSTSAPWPAQRRGGDEQVQVRLIGFSSELLVADLGEPLLWRCLAPAQVHFSSGVRLHAALCCWRN